MEQAQTFRIHSIDILRGIVMIIMALDHTRDFFHETAFTADPLDVATTTPALYFTRWITHFCAPTFVFLSGVSAYLSSKNKARSDASVFMIKRGIWLIFIEVAVITLGLTFNPLYNLIVWQVIWAIGWSMIFLGILMRFSFNTVLVAGVILFFGHNLLDYATLPQTGLAGNLLKVFLTNSFTTLQISPDRFILVIYAILPWTGIMLLGYCAGYWYRKEFSAIKRKQLLLVTGSLLIVLFIILRITNVYGNPTDWDGSDLFTFLNTSKYPPSLQYSSMTLGPALILLALLENIKAKWTKVVSVYGRVPFFYYVLHFYLIHTLLVVLFFATGHTSSQIVDPQTPFLFRPALFGYNLWIVYGIWLCIVFALYFPCRWFNRYKETHTQWWLRYL
jgi:uncharacterized membrane protein